MIIPLDMDTLSVLLASSAIILLITTELLSSSYLRITFNRKKLRQVAVVFSIAFMVTVGIKIIGILWTEF